MPTFALLAHRVLNINREEVPRMAVAWTLQALLRVGFVMGWTVTLAIFIHRMGIEWLPKLIGLQAILMIGSSLFYAELLKQTHRTFLMIMSLFIASALMIFSIVVIEQNVALFVGSILIAQAVLLSQVGLLFNLLTEDLFTPLESQRTFPIIASAETLGGIIGGLMIAGLSPFIAPYKFILLWVITLMMIIPFLVLAQRSLKTTPSLQEKTVHKKNGHRHLHPFKTIRQNAWRLRRVPFLRSMAGLILIQFLLFNVLEFQYLKSVQTAVVEQTKHLNFEINTYRTDEALKVSLWKVKTLDPDVVAETVEHALTQKLGLLQIIFSSGSLLVQLLLTSRILSSVGLVGSLFLHPLTALTHFLALFWNFNFLTAAISRSSFEITGTIFKNAYHATYYVISEISRGQIKELIEGFVKPLGAIGAFGVILLAQNMPPSWENQILTLILIIGALGMLLPLLFLKSNYLQLAKQQFLQKKNLSSRLNATEILVQEGRSAERAHLLQTLRQPQENNLVKSKILATFKQKPPKDQLLEVIDQLEGPPAPWTRELLDTLLACSGLREKFMGMPFLKQRAIDRLKELFQTVPCPEIQNRCVRALAHIEDNNLIPFLLTLLKKHKEPKVQMAAIQACQWFEDPGMVKALLPHLKSPDPQVRAETIKVLWKFKELRPRLHAHSKINKPHPKTTP